jgi:nitroreductase
MSDSKLIKSLRAVRQFSDREIPDELLRDVLDAARWTGSAKNSQPWDLVVVRNRETLKALAECGQFAGHLAGAKLAIALVMHEDKSWAHMDEGRLMQNVMLAAWAHGVGSCIASIFPDANQTRARELLGIPETLHLRTVLSVGYPASPEALRLPPNAPLPRGRRSLDDLVSWERFGKR